MPQPLRTNRGRRPERERGAALVETAIILPVLLLIVFAVFELGMMFRSATVASSATRSGARLASANYGPAPNGARAADTVTVRLEVGDLVAGAVAETLRDRTNNDTPVALRVYRAGTNGLPDTGNVNTCTSRCLRYSWSGTAWVYEGGDWTDPDACGSTIESIGVWMSIRHDPSTDLVPIGKVIDEYSVMRLEPRPGSQCTGIGGES